MEKSWKSWARIIFSIVITNVLMVGILGLLFWMGLMEKLQTDFVFMHGIYSLVGVLYTLLVLWLFVKIDKQNPWKLGFKVSKRDAFFSVIATIVTFAVVITFIWLLDEMGIVIAKYQFHKVFSGEFYKLFVIAFMGWFFAALKEEVLARGYFMANLTRLSIINMILVSSVLFMALHFIMGDFDPFKAASWFKGGIVYGYIYLKTGSITVATIVHTVHNLANALVIHGHEGALVLLNTKVTTADKLIYEVVLALFLLAITYFFYGKNGLLMPADNLKILWRKMK